MNVHYIITYDISTREILTCVPVGAEYPAEGAIEGTNTAILHKREGIDGRIQDWSDNHWIDQGYNFIHKGTRPGSYWDWDLETRTWKFNFDTFWNHVKKERTRRLYMCDWTQVADAPITEAQQEEWKSYRTVLRDLPKDTIDVQSMNAIPWPAPPNNEKIEVTVW